jgi:hypothetical protein
MNTVFKCRDCGNVWEWHGPESRPSRACPRRGSGKLPVNCTELGKLVAEILSAHARVEQARATLFGEEQKRHAKVSELFGKFQPQHRRAPK